MSNSGIFLHTLNFGEFKQTTPKSHRVLSGDKAQIHTNTSTYTVSFQH
ncbi:hypothetical protein CRENPOLYSF2_4670002 [Crenothrix polyspora]|uniref:Uncharacterized protein n=1 Tax=Crenothrix polyspora TaxID=360316 RepID=A0A1R4HG23_9GAMM|nr:hypothetical protein CRENPOLYSF2_4670002 [Crenothrix polyspora]